jgi:23S rRNA (cytidine1920-2'-O)/16S rRNA (cytidine1409-2'-O)-methyltransferase
LADVVVLVKPQFELGPRQVGKGGIVRNPADRAAAVQAARDAAAAVGFVVVDTIASPITGRDGNEEFLMWLRWDDARHR